MKAALVLEDGTVFEGLGFGAEGEASGEAVFYTGVVGYQEVLTSPSYRGTLVVLTYPMIGSYGVTEADSQSASVQASGVVIRDYSARWSNFRATGSLEDFLCEQGIAGVRGVDTRAVAVHLRERGEMKGAIAAGDFDAAEVAGKLKTGKSAFEADLAADAELVILSGGGRKLALLDAGATRGLMSQLADLGFAEAERGADAARVKAAGPVGLIAAGGGGDPRMAKVAAAALKPFIGEMPVLGVGLGCELVALALGCTVSRMKTGHHGINQSVRDVGAGKCLITAQHHSFVVEGKLPGGVQATHVNVNDGTVEGIDSRGEKAAGVQFHPGRDEAGAPSAILERFVEGKHA